MLVEAIGNVEQVIRRILLMCKNKGADALAMCRLMIEAPADVGGTAKLASLENKRPDPARLFALSFKALVKMVLLVVQDERDDRAGRGANL